MSDKIIEALSKLDSGNDDHWTSEGLPRLDVMKDLVGAAVTRAEVTSAVKGFTRANPIVEDLDAETTGDGTDAGDAAAPQATIDDGPAAGTDEGAVDEGAEAAARKEHDEAMAALHKAQKRVDAATRAIDALIAAKSRRQTSSDRAHDVQAYQRAQNAQRASLANQTKMFAQQLTKA